MIDIPPKIRVRATIKPGSVYYFPEETIDSSGAHYFIVLNTNPQTDTVLILVCASSKINKVRKRRRTCPRKTLIEITSKQYSGFSRDSIIDCNRIIEKTTEQLIDKLSKGKLRMEVEMDLLLVNQIIEGVMQSPLIELRVKKMLQGAVSQTGKAIKP